MLPSAFEDKPLCVPRQLAELLQLSVEEVCANFDAMLRHDWSTARRRCYMYRAVKRVLRAAARVLYRGRQGRPCRPSKSRRFDAADGSRGCSCEDLRERPAHGRRREPKVAMTPGLAHKIFLKLLKAKRHSEKTLRESAPTSLESRVAPGVMSTPGAPSCPLWFLRRRRAQRTARRRGRGAQRAGQRPLSPAHPVPGGRRP